MKTIIYIVLLPIRIIQALVLIPYLHFKLKRVEKTTMKTITLNRKDEINVG